MVYEHHAILWKVGCLITSLLGEAGGEGPDFFGNIFTEFPLPSIRPMCYPKRTSNIPKAAYLPDGRGESHRAIVCLQSKVLPVL